MTVGVDMVAQGTFQHLYLFQIGLRPAKELSAGAKSHGGFRLVSNSPPARQRHLSPLLHP